jgi:adenosylmethionine---8-amino-7-oxononanoate aminotransferase
MTDHLWLPYAQMKTMAPPLAVTRAEGCKIFLADGRVLIDGIASWWTQCHGYNHPHIVDAIKQQADQLSHVMLGGLVHEPAQKLAARLAKLLPGDLDHVFFSDSGSVAVEVALKMALQYWINLGATGRTKILAFRHGYHGDTLGAMSVTDPDEGMHHLFKGMLPQQIFADLPTNPEKINTLTVLLEKNADSIAAIIVEPLVQGAGGMLFHAPEVLRQLRALADQHNVLLIFDEIFTGFGRVGTMFACEQAGAVPDIITLGKALTGGAVTLAATVARRNVFEAFYSDRADHAFMHGPTYMGNPLACAAANSSLDLFEREPRLQQGQKINQQLRRELEPCRAIDGVRDVRTLGAIGAVELSDAPDLRWLRNIFPQHGVWIRPFHNVVYLTPALTIMPHELSKLTDATIAVLKEYAMYSDQQLTRQTTTDLDA